MAITCYPVHRSSIFPFLIATQIIVSLKEGLFTGANVLFKARFRDGTSIVEVRSPALL